MQDISWSGGQYGATDFIIEKDSMARPVSGQQIQIGLNLLTKDGKNTG